MDITFDEALIDEIAARFDLRAPNKRALTDIVKALAEADGEFRELIADLATGVGKTFLMSSLVEYLAQQGVRHFLVVTPGSVIQRKTLANFNAGSAKYVAGADIAPFVITPDNFQSGSVATALHDPNRLKVFVFNIQQLIKPGNLDSAEATTGESARQQARRVRRADENIGGALYDHLENRDDLVVIADEHHLYHARATAFSAAIAELNPIAVIGLTATPDPEDSNKIVSQYTLGEAIADGFVKTPVIVYRKDGMTDERTQLRDACQILHQKEISYAAYESTVPDSPAVKPVLFVVCQSIAHATDVGQLLASEGYIGDPAAVLEITSDASDAALQALAEVEEPESPIRAIISVNMLGVGWDVKNIAVIVALRRLASQCLTEQILGRGLRLPFGERTGVPDVDQVDLVAHDSYRQLLEQKDVLHQRIQQPANDIEVDDHGAALAADSSTTNHDPDSISDENLSEDVHDRLAELNKRTVGDDDDDSSTDDLVAPMILFDETEKRLETPAATFEWRVDGAPQIIFPLRRRVLATIPFALSDISDDDAKQVGARFISEVPTFLFRDALEAEGSGDDVKITVRRLETEQAVQTVVPIDEVQLDLERAIMTTLDEVPRDLATKNAARRLVRAFLKGAGASSPTARAEWGVQRREHAVNGMRLLIRAAMAERKTTESYAISPVTLPNEPVIVPGDVGDAANDPYVRDHPFRGWGRSILPIARFDAKSTEWELAHLIDRDSDISWWLRLDVFGSAYISTERDGRYFPDFVVLDTSGVNWLVEAKSDRNAQDADVLRKRDAAERWARAVTDTDEYGTWRYLLATETNIKHAAGSWNGLLIAANALTD